MITLFRNKEKNTYFFVDPKNKTVKFISSREVGVFVKYKDYLETVVVHLPNYELVTKFKREVANGLLDNLDRTQLATEVRNKYPEYFI